MKLVTPLLLAAALAVCLPAVAATPVIDVEDPAGDDVGAGQLVYSRDAAVQEGDLDLRRLQVFEEAGGLRFEATFRNPIRHPSTVQAPGLGSEDLSVFARRGFYAFNLDLYLDTDRRPGSGTQATLPGRGGRIAAEHAWERAIVLTPRPELMRKQLAEALAESGGAAQAEAALAQQVYFPTEVRVRGRTVSFFVPAAFFAGQGKPADWAITGLVTAAKLSIESDLRFGQPAASALERLVLGAEQPVAGLPPQGMGWRGDAAPATAIVDLLMPAEGVQQAQLSRGQLVGLARDNRMGLALAPTPTATPAAIAAAPAPASGGGWFSRAMDKLGGLFGSGAAAASAPAAAAAAAAARTPAPAMQTLLEPGAVRPAAETAAAPTARPLSAAPVPAPASTTAAPAAVLAAPAALPAAAVVAPAAAGVAATTAATASPVASPVPAASVAPSDAAKAAPSAPAARPPVKDAAYMEELQLRMRTLKRMRAEGLISEADFQKKNKELLDAL